MRAKINESHPDFPEYLEKCKVLWARYKKLIDKEEAKYPEWHTGLKTRHPASDEVRRIMKRHDNELIALQAEYKYLFTKTEENN